jgi:hypothetical protein
LSAKPGPPQTLRDLIAAGQRFELVVATPSRNDFRLLGADFPDLDRLERDLPLFKLMEEDAAVIIAAHLSDLPIIVTKLLPLLSFERPSCVWLAQRPATRDVTDAEIVVIGHRRGANLSMSAVEGWPNEGEPQDILELAGRLFPDVARKLHVFAQAKTDGWLSLSSEDTWIGPTI